MALLTKSNPDEEVAPKQLLSHSPAAELTRSYFHHATGRHRLKQPTSQQDDLIRHVLSVHCRH